MSVDDKIDIKTEMVHGFQRIIFTGALIYGNTEKVREKVFSVLTECQGYILDMENVEVIDSTGFGILVSIAKKLKHNQDRMVVIINKSELLQLFKITKMTLIFPIVKSKEEAVKLLSADIKTTPELLIDDY